MYGVTRIKMIAIEKRAYSSSGVAQNGFRKELRFKGQREERQPDFLTERVTWRSKDMSPQASEIHVPGRVSGKSDPMREEAGEAQGRPSTQRQGV